ncbi:MAG: hypothetical protein P8Y45_03585, partial [Exilibacterium sp.]
IEKPSANRKAFAQAPCQAGDGTPRMQSYFFTGPKNKFVFAKLYFELKGKNGVIEDISDQFRTS